MLGFAVALCPVLLGAPMRNCDVAFLPTSLQCKSRSEVLAWYYANEQACRGPASLAEHDKMQYGVPSEMQNIAENAQIPAHRLYWGFDSFRGLPSEANDEPYKNPLWKPGVFSDVYGMAPGFRTVSKPRDGVWRYESKSADAQPLSVEAAMHRRMTHMQGERNRMKLVPGFYNESLTPALAATARPVSFADFNCDLTVSTLQAQRWLFTHKLLRPGSLISYDDWFHAPFGFGESAAHIEVSHEFKVEYEHLGKELRQGWGAACKLVFFRIKSIGRHADPAITPRLNHTVYWN